MWSRWRSLTRSTTVRFVLLAFLCQLPVTGGLLIFVQQASQRALIGEQKDYVSELRAGLEDGFRAGGRDELVRLIRARVQSARSGTAVLLLIARDGRAIIGNIDAWPPTVAHTTPWRTIDLYRTGSDRPERMGIATAPLPDGTILLTGRVIDDSERLDRINEEAVLAALLLGVLLTFACALLLGRYLSRQIGHVVDTSVAVAGGSLGRRVPVDDSGDAFDALGKAINGMLERIEALVSQLRMMTDGLAHDLRSPVTRLKSVLEHAMMDVQDPAAIAALERVADEAETLLQMLSTALSISRADAGIGRDNFMDVSLSDLLNDLAEIYGPLVEERGFQIDAAAPHGLTLAVHRELISQAIGNLIENALKYATGGHRILLAAMAVGDHIDIIVADDGCGIPADRRAEALARFGRLDLARQIPGSGLGLALVGAVAHLHGGTIALEDAAPGLRVRIRVPV